MGERAARSEAGEGDLVAGGGGGAGREEASGAARRSSSRSPGVRGGEPLRDDFPLFRKSSEPPFKALPPKKRKRVLRHLNDGRIYFSKTACGPRSTSKDMKY